MKELKDRIVAGERAAIAKAITLVESSRDEDIQQSHELISQLIKSPGHAIRVGFSGLLVWANLPLLSPLGHF